MKIKLLLIFLIWGTSLITASQFPIGTRFVECVIEATVTNVESMSENAQKVSLQIISSRLSARQSSSNVAAEDCKLTTIDKAVYQYSPCTDTHLCTIISGGDGPKLSSGQYVQGWLNIRIDYRGSFYSFEASKAGNWESKLRFGRRINYNEDPRLDISPGWNLISLPATNYASYKLKKAYADNYEKSVSAWTYVDKKYQKVSIAEISSGYSYWVYSQYGAELKYENATPISLPRQYKTGWNAIDHLFNSQGKNCEIEKGPFGWQQMEKKWYETNELERGTGYFVKLKKDCGNEGEALNSLKWVSIQPTQCNNLWNEWHTKIYGTNWWGNPNRNKIKNGYYSKNEDLLPYWLSNEYGIQVQAYEEYSGEAPQCSSCDCLTGGALKILVYEKDVPKLEELGFKAE